MTAASHTAQESITTATILQPEKKGKCLMTTEQTITCNAIIHTASAAAGAIGAGLAQIPCSDSLVIVPIQTAMVIAIAKVFGFEISDGAAKAAITSAAASAVGRGISQIGAGWIPIAGNILNAATAASITEGIGWAVAAEYDSEAEKEG
jgi:uncharacterized protein (DUF697 family)